jgi:hypothetical protein
MAILSFLLLSSAAYPLWLVWRANRHTTLIHAVSWAIAAWAAWGGAIGLSIPAGSCAGLETARLVALALSGCAGVAVLGARRPGVGAWNLVVLGLAAVMLLPLVERALAAEQPLDPIRVVFLCSTLAVGILNYLPTRLGPAAVLLALGYSLEAWALLSREAAAKEFATTGWLCLGLAPWFGLLCWRMQRAPGAAFDQVWLDFRNRFGLVWGQRVREQFNRAAINAGWSVHLYWQGLCLMNEPGSLQEGQEEEMLRTLRALLQRFLTKTRDR